MTGRLFAALLVLTLVFRFWLAAAFPITGDEAYFIWWGWMPDWGFYDHPPMIGWWLAALSLVGKAEWWLRLPVILQPALLALAVYCALPRLVAGVEEERRQWAAMLVLLAPVNAWSCSPVKRRCTASFLPLVVRVTTATSSSSLR